MKISPVVRTLIPFEKSMQRQNPSSPLAQRDLCVGTTGHGRESRLPFITTVKQFVPRFLHVFDSGFRPTNQTTQYDDSSRSRHVTKRSLMSAGIGCAIYEIVFRRVLPNPPPHTHTVAPTHPHVLPSLHCRRMRRGDCYPVACHT